MEIGEDKGLWGIAKDQDAVPIKSLAVIGGRKKTFKDVEREGIVVFFFQHVEREGIDRFRGDIEQRGGAQGADIPVVETWFQVSSGKDAFPEFEHIVSGIKQGTKFVLTQFMLARKAPLA